MQKPEVIICGFGRVGQIVAQVLESRGVPYTAIELNVDKVIQGRQSGFNVFYGDTNNSDVLRSMGLAARKTRAVIIALDNAWIAKSTVRAVRTVSPRVKIFARARNIEESKILMKEGVKEALPETMESSLLLGQGVLSSIGVPHDEIEDIMIKMRRNNYEYLDKVSEKK